MSVINRMLQDLETRRDEAGPVEGDRVYQDLRPVRAGNSATRSIGMLLIFAIVASVVVGAWWLVRDRLTTSPMLVEVRKPEPIAAVPQQPEPVAPPEVAPIPATSGVEAPIAVPENSIAQKETAQTAAAPKPVEASPPVAPKPVPPSKVAEKPKPVTTAKAPPAPPPVKRPAPKTTAPVTTATTAGIEKTMKPLTPAERAEKEFMEASELLKSGRAPEAERHLAAALEADATHAQAREILVGLKLRRGDIAGAKSLLEAGIAAAPAHYPFVQILARLHVDQGNDAQALAVLEQNRARFAASADYLSFYAAMLQRVNRHADALQVYQQVLVHRPNDGRLWIGLGISLEARQDPTAARKAYERARATGTLDRGLDQYVADRLRKL